MNSHDLSALESEILQLDSEVNAALNKSGTPKLFPNGNDDGEIGESQLMELCSGAFVTQFPESVSHKSNTQSQAVEPNADQPNQTSKSTEASTPQNEAKDTSPANKNILEANPAFLSDDEEIEAKDASTAADKVKKKRKRQTLVYSGNCRTFP